MPQPLSDIGERIDLLKMTLGLFAPEEPAPIARELVELAEEVFEHWLLARREAVPGDTPGSRLNALHQAAVRGEPALADMAGKCREVLRLRDLVTADAEHADTLDRLILEAELAGGIYSAVSRRMMGLGGANTKA